MPSHLDDLLTEIAELEDRRQKWRERHVEDRRKRAEEWVAGRSGKGRLVSVSRYVQRRVRIYPWTAVSLDELALVRMSNWGGLSAGILEGVAQLWQRHKHDEHLYLRRVENPEDAEAVIGVAAAPLSGLVHFTEQANFLLRVLAIVVGSLLRQGVSHRDIAELVAEVKARVG